jgi:hypothetical protein
VPISGLEIVPNEILRPPGNRTSLWLFMRVCHLSLDRAQPGMRKLLLGRPRNTAENARIAKRGICLRHHATNSLTGKVKQFQYAQSGQASAALDLCALVVHHQPLPG